jgi:hypothetical protein
VTRITFGLLLSFSAFSGLTRCAGHFKAAGFEYETERTKVMNSHGIKAIRFENDEVFKALEAVFIR